ncbi:hypothetical protein D9M69_502110 [compost metagenome]
MGFVLRMMVRVGAKRSAFVRGGERRLAGTNPTNLARTHWFSSGADLLCIQLVEVAVGGTDDARRIVCPCNPKAHSPNRRRPSMLVGVLRRIRRYRFRQP